MGVVGRLRTRDPGAIAEIREALSEDIETWCAALFLFERQWGEVRRYAASRGVRLVGDTPIYVGQDSVDVWANQSLFLLDDQGLPTRVAGVPPDAYSETGQRWGNPLFDWAAMAADKHQWWTARIARLLEHCDAMRIDHFIGFSRYWSVDADEETATNGEWAVGPGRALFDDIENALGPLPLIAEDLGSVDEGTVASGTHSVCLACGCSVRHGWRQEQHPSHPATPGFSVAYTTTQQPDSWGLVDRSRRGRAAPHGHRP